MIGEVGKIVRVEGRTLGRWEEGGKSGKEIRENGGSASVRNSGGVAKRRNLGLSLGRVKVSSEFGWKFGEGLEDGIQGTG